MYTPEERMAYVSCKCDPRAFAGSADKQADDKLSGGFNTGKNNICPTCKEARSVNGMCGCPADEAPKTFFCVDCGIELDIHDVDANLNMYGVFKGYCSDCCGNDLQ
jgi:hypothetical protein